MLASLKKNALRKYLPDTRTDPSDWKTGKSSEEIAKLKADGKFVDLIQWRAHRSNAVGMTDDAYVLEYRLGDAGKDMFGSNADNNAIASWNNGKWTVVLVRPLGLTNSDDKALKEGGVYNVGLGAKADIQAVKLP